MIVFYTTPTQQLRIRLPFKRGKSIIARFADGEIHVQLEQLQQKIKENEIWVIAATPAPADNYMELFLLLDALQHAGAQVNLMLTYCGYARQDKDEIGQGVGARVIANALKNFNIKQTFIVHPHSIQLQKFLPHKAIMPYDLFYPIAHKYDVIVAPDHGAQKLAQHISNECDKPFIIVQKKRIAPDHIAIEKIETNIKKKKILIVDDMICTGSTTMTVAAQLKEKGADSIDLMATHGIFAGDAREQLTQSNINHIYVTNSLRQTYASKKITIIDIAPTIQTLIKDGE